ncbi:MAG: hypothetical protein WBP26_03400 [Candidatus Saccharimonadales bacterium]
MDKKKIRLLKNACWTAAGLSMFFLILSDTKNNLTTINALLFIILGIVFNALEDRK